MGLLAYELGHWSESLELYERAGAIWESTGDRWSATFAKYNRGEILSDQGRFDQAEEQLREALRVWRASSAAPEIAQATTAAGPARSSPRRRRHRPPPARIDSRRSSSRTGRQPRRCWTEAWIVEADVLAGKAADAGRASRSCGPGRRSSTPVGGSFRCCSASCGWALLELGAVDDAAAAFEVGLAEASGRSAGFELAALLEGSLLVAEARSGGDPELEAALEAKLAELGIVVNPAARLLAPGAALVRAGSREAAENQTRALDISPTVPRVGLDEHDHEVAGAVDVPRRDVRVRIREPPEPASRGRAPSRGLCRRRRSPWTPNLRRSRRGSDR